VKGTSRAEVPVAIAVLACFVLTETLVIVTVYAGFSAVVVISTRASTIAALAGHLGADLPYRTLEICGAVNFCGIWGRALAILPIVASCAAECGVDGLGIAAVAAVLDVVSGGRTMWLGR
jgi:hypothetical protein